MSLETMQVDQADSQNNELAAAGEGIQVSTPLVPRMLKHGLSVVFLASTLTVNGEFNSYILAEHINTLTHDRRDLVCIYRDDEIGNEDPLFLPDLNQSIELHCDSKAVLVIIYNYQGSASFTAIRDYLNARYQGIHYEVSLVQNKGECVDLFYQYAYEIEPEDTRIAAFRLAMSIFEDNDPRTLKRKAAQLDMSLCNIKKLALQTLTNS
jgi:hypothetical protein